MSEVDADRPRTTLIDRFWLVLPYALLVITLAITLAGAPSGPELAGMLGLAAAIAAWHWWWTIRHPHRLGSRPLPMAVYFLGMLTGTAVLCGMSFSFLPVYLVCFALAFVVLPGGWAYAGIALTTLLALLVPWMLTPTFDNVAAIVGGGVLASAAGWSIRALESSRDRLERALAANRALQEQLVTDARESGRTAERARLSAELHDTVAAGLTGVLSQLEATDAALEAGHPARERVRISADAARETLVEARRAIVALRPSALTAGSLPSALATVTSGFQRAHSVPVLLHITGREIPASDAVAHVIVRAAQEALTNAAQHADARLVHVTLSYLEDDIALDVSDDGAGLAPRSSRTGGQGLHLMRERAEAVGGTVTVRSAAGRGTTVTLSIPLGSRDER